MATEVADEDRNKEVSGLVRPFLTFRRGTLTSDYTVRDRRVDWVRLPGTRREVLEDEVAPLPLHWCVLNVPSFRARLTKLCGAGVDWDARAEKKAIFKIQGEGKSWAQAVDKEKGSFDYVHAPTGEAFES